MVVHQLKVKTMQMLIKMCEKLCEFFKMNLKYQRALHINHSIVTEPKVANLKEGITLVLYYAYAGLIRLPIHALCYPTGG